MIEIQNVSFSYQEEEQNLKSIHLTIAPGKCVLLCGTSGCGKTTITKLINGLIPHYEDGRLEGQTLVNGRPVGETPLYELSQTVGSVFQNPKSQFFNIDSDNELAFGLETQVLLRHGFAAVSSRLWRNCRFSIYCTEMFSLCPVEKNSP